MLARQLKGQQVPLVAFCQGFLTCLWIWSPRRKAGPYSQVIWRQQWEFEKCYKSIICTCAHLHLQRMPIAAHVNMYTEMFWICSVNFWLWNKCSTAAHLEYKNKPRLFVVVTALHPTADSILSVHSLCERHALFWGTKVFGLAKPCFPDHVSVIWTSSDLLHVCFQGLRFLYVEPGKP